MAQGSAASFITPRIDDSSQRLEFKSAAALATGLGLSGVDDIDDTNQHNGVWWCFHALTNCVFTSVTYKDGTSSGSKAGKTLLAGDRIYGQIIGIKLSSGQGEAYRAAI